MPLILPFAATLAGVGVYSLMDALMKSAALAVGAYSALLLRSLLGLAMIGPLWLALRDRWPSRAALRLHLLRGTVAAAMAFTFFWGLARLPLAEAIALAFIAPLIALYLAAAMLGEVIERRAVIASLLGLAGVVVIGASRLSGGPWDGAAAWGMGSILLSSVLYAWNLVLQRQQALIARPAEVTTFHNLVVSLVLLPFAPWLLAAPGRGGWLELGAAAALAVAAALLTAWAYARAPAQDLVPLEYSGFLWAALFGWLLFGEIPTAAVVAGALLIVTACWIAAPRKRPEIAAV